MKERKDNHSYGTVDNCCPLPAILQNYQLLMFALLFFPSKRHILTNPLDNLLILSSLIILQFGGSATTGAQI